MDWLIALLLLFGSVADAAEERKLAAETAAKLALQAEVQQETAWFADADADNATSGAPAGGWSVYPATVNQGDALLLRAPEGGEVAWNGATYTLRQFGEGYYAMLPVPMNHKPGTYEVGGTSVTVKTKAFDTQRLTVTEEQAQMQQNTKRISEDQVKINKARSVTANKFLYTESFLLPVKGRLTTPYGFTRYVNGKFSGSHQALDLAAPTGTPVKATNDGVVVLAEELYLTGNAIYVDHGMNLFSQYIHLDEILVEVGQQVKRGDVIGKVGTTGFSTGPHLHFTFWIGNTPVNPNLFFDTLPFRWNTKTGPPG